MTTLPLAQNQAPSQLLQWVVVSIALYAATTNLVTWVLVRSGPEGRSRRFVHSPLGQVVGWLAWMIWLIAPGYAALLLGDLSPRLMGLSQIDLGTGLGMGALFAAFGVVALLSAGLAYRRALPAHRPYVSPGHAIAASVRLFIEAGALQWHWAFYRSAIIAAVVGIGRDSPAYWGSWLAVAVICAEGACSPFLWHALRTPGLAEKRILRGVLLLATTVLYLLSRDFWLMWALHGLVIVILEPRLTHRPGTALGLPQTDPEAQSK